MKRDLREMIGNYLILNSPLLFLSLYGSIFVHDTYCMFSNFTLAIKFDCVFLTIFQSFHLFVSFIFSKLAPPLNTVYVSKGVLNHYLVQCNAFNSLKSAKNVVFFSFCILVDMPMGQGAIAPAPLATLLYTNMPSLVILHYISLSHTYFLINQGCPTFFSHGPNLLFQMFRGPKI